MDGRFRLKPLLYRSFVNTVDFFFFFFFVDVLLWVFDFVFFVCVF